MTEPKCGAHCGLDPAVIDPACIHCEIHGLCHMCAEEAWAKKFDEIKAEHERIAARVEKFESALKLVLELSTIKESLTVRALDSSARGVRASGTVSCGYCGDRGHNARTCPDGYEVAARHARIRELLDGVCGFAVAYDRDGCEELKEEVLELLRIEVNHARQRGRLGEVRT